MSERVDLAQSKLRDAFEYNGLAHTRMPTRPDCELRGLRKFNIGGIAFDVFGNMTTGDLYARAYIAATGEVAWYSIVNLAALVPPSPPATRTPEAP